MKPQRIRDPLHDIIEFDTSKFEQTLWSLIDTPEFQRLRRIRQLGFSEFVFPGATHTRFVHSIGVFETARELLSVVKRQLDSAYNDERAKVALVSALVHDVGHGPFSHAFETAQKALNRKRAVKKANNHEERSAEIVGGQTKIGHIITNELGSDCAKAVSDLLLSEHPTDIYSSIVSSQLDADRLDYIRRDRLMTGVHHGGFDFSWLVTNLQVGSVTYATDDQTYGEADTLILGSKSFQAAESYVLGLFHLYFTVYFHKATRSAEKMLTALLVRLGSLCDEGRIPDTGLHEADPLVAFAQNDSLTNYLGLDDTVIWGSLSRMAKAKDSDIATLSSRILNRDLYKCAELPSAFQGGNNGELKIKLRKKISDAKESGALDETEVFEDFASRNPYKRRGYDSVEALQKIFIMDQGSGQQTDLSALSPTVASLEQRELYRIYVRDSEASQKILQMAGEITNG